MEKDLIQACAVAKRVMVEEKLLDEVRRLWKSMPLSWQKKIKASALSISDYVVDCKVKFSTILGVSEQN